MDFLTRYSKRFAFAYAFACAFAYAFACAFACASAFFIAFILITIAFASRLGNYCLNLFNPPISIIFVIGYQISCFRITSIISICNYKLVLV